MDELSAGKRRAGEMPFHALGYQYLKSQYMAHRKEQMAVKAEEVWRQNPNVFARLIMIKPGSVTWRSADVTLLCGSGTESSVCFWVFQSDGNTVLETVVSTSTVQ